MAPVLEPMRVLVGAQALAEVADGMRMRCSMYVSGVVSGSMLVS